MPVQDYDSGPDYGSKNKELLEELDKKLSTARTKLQKLMDAAEEREDLLSDIVPTIRREWMQEGR